jgi:hypothetical protein
MSMYAQLLDAAIGKSAPIGTRTSRTEAYSKFLSARRQLSTRVKETLKLDNSSAAIAHQIEYDIALIDLAHSLDIACDVKDFDQPLRERLRLEQALQAQGIRLDGFESL